MSQTCNDSLNVNQSVKTKLQETKLQETATKGLGLSSKLDATLNVGVFRLRKAGSCSQQVNSQQVNAKPSLPVCKEESPKANDSQEAHRERSVGSCNKVNKDKKRVHRNGEDLQYCKEQIICLTSSSLECPKKEEQDNRIPVRRNVSDRSEIEGKCAKGRRSNGLERLRTHLLQTSETVTALQQIVLNLERKVRILSDKVSSR